MKDVICFFIFTSCVYVFGQSNEAAPWNYSSDKNKAVKTLEQESLLFEQYWKNRDMHKKGSGVKPFKRWQYHWQNQLTNKGTPTSPKQIWQIWQQKLQITQSNISEWKSIGPYTTNVKHGQGRVNTFIVDPNDDETFFVGAPAGGIWKSEDSGTDWKPMSDDIPQIGVSGIAIDPNNSAIIYIATGDDDARDTYSIGILKINRRRK